VPGSVLNALDMGVGETKIYDLMQVRTYVRKIQIDLSHILKC
jgi:hypothetical protein